jgi:hypothetical protein
MPSAEYYWRQADLCVRLSLLSGDDEAAKLLVLKALELLALAEEAAAGPSGRYDPTSDAGG